MKVEQFPLRTIFLKRFVQEILKQKSASQKTKITTSPESLKKDFEKEKTLPILPIPKKMPAQNQPTRTIPKKEEKSEKENGLTILSPFTKQPKVVRFANAYLLPQKAVHTNYLKPVPPQPFQRPNLPTPSPSSPQVFLESLKKVNSIMQEPFFQSIECTGPGKPVIIKRGNIVQTLPITFTKEEIDAVLEEVSKKTRIPLTKGIFTAALGDKILNAVISDFVGSRFIIQKKEILTNH